MFNNQKLSLKKLNYLYLFINFLIYSLILGIIVISVNDSYHLYINEYNTYLKAKSISNSTTHLDVFLKNLSFGLLWSIGKVFLTVIALVIIKIIIMRIPISSKYILHLDKNNEISSILGRYLCNHLRNKSYIDFFTLIFLSQEADYESYIINKNSKKNDYQQLFNKYDLFYEKDIKK